MFTADQLVAHAIGDYILQSHWMATNKTKSSVVAAIHAVTYTIPFLFITQSPIALAAICVPHFFIDRFRLARYLVWLKNGPIDFAEKGNIGDDSTRWKPVTATGYDDDVPAWLSVWLLIAADNIIHVVTNGLALHFLG